MPPFESQEGPSDGLEAVTTCFFDLDDTLYPLSSGLAAACRINIQDFMVEKLGIPPESVAERSLELYGKYGTTMAGLRAEGYRLDFDEYHGFVHGRLPYHKLRPDPELRRMIEALPVRKFVFTNGDRAHAATCLSRLGLDGCFADVIHFERIMAAPPVLEEGGGREGLVCCKPMPEAFLRAAAIAGADLRQTIMFDDSTRNIAAAKGCGMTTVLVGYSVPTAGADFAVTSLHEMPDVLPGLFRKKREEPLKQDGADSEKLPSPPAGPVALGR